MQMSNPTSSQPDDQSGAADILKRLNEANGNYCTSIQRTVEEGRTNLAGAFQRYARDLAAAPCQVEQNQETYRKLINELTDAGKDIHAALRKVLADYIETIRGALADAEAGTLRLDALATLGASLQNVAYWNELIRSNLHNSLAPWIPGGIPN
jgi:hypothetical protein